MVDVLRKRLPLLSIRVRGAWQKEVIFQVRHGKQYVRTYSEYDGSAKLVLLPYQMLFALAVHSWQDLSDNEKEYWTAKSKTTGRRLPGYNYFISCFLKENFVPPSFVSGDYAIDFCFPLLASFSFPGGLSLHSVVSFDYGTSVPVLKLSAPGPSFLVPDAAGTYQQGTASSGTRLSCIDDPVNSPDDELTYIYGHFVEGGTGYDVVSFSSTVSIFHKIPISNVSICFRAAVAFVSSFSWNGLLRLNGVDKQTTKTFTETTYGLNSFDYSLSPFSGLSWTAAEVCALEFGLRIETPEDTDGKGIVPFLSQLYLKVDYS